MIPGVVARLLVPLRDLGYIGEARAEVYRDEGAILARVDVRDPVIILGLLV